MKTNKTPFVLTVIAAAALMIVGVGCEKKNETMGEKLDNATEKAKDAASDAKDAVKDAAHKTGEAIKDGAQATKDAVTNAVNNLTNTNK